MTEPPFPRTVGPPARPVAASEKASMSARASATAASAFRFADDTPVRSISTLRPRARPSRRRAPARYPDEVQIDDLDPYRRRRESKIMCTLTTVCQAVLQPRPAATVKELREQRSRNRSRVQVPQLAEAVAQHHDRVRSAGSTDRVDGALRRLRPLHARRDRIRLRSSARSGVCVLFVHSARHAHDSERAPGDRLRTMRLTLVAREAQGVPTVPAGS